MSYQSVIELVATNMRIKVEDSIFKAVQDVGVNVDKDELIKALRYDRGQYEKGYADRDAEIVRCKDCWKRKFDNCPFYEYSMVVQEDDFFCADGEKERSGNDA